MIIFGFKAWDNRKNRWDNEVPTTWIHASSGFSKTIAIRNERDKQEASTSGIPCKKKKEMTGKILNEVDSL